jgi:hypothetical protein
MWQRPFEEGLNITREVKDILSTDPEELDKLLSGIR